MVQIVTPLWLLTYHMPFGYGIAHNNKNYGMLYEMIWYYHPFKMHSLNFAIAYISFIGKREFVHGISLCYSIDAILVSIVRKPSITLQIMLRSYASRMTLKRWCKIDTFSIPSHSFRFVRAQTKATKSSNAFIKANDHFWKDSKFYCDVLLTN